MNELKSMNKLIATEVMGWTLKTHAHYMHHGGIPAYNVSMYLNKDSNHFVKFCSDWNPSTNIVDALLVVEKMRDLKKQMTIYTCCPLAICKAALLSITTTY